MSAVASGSVAARALGAKKTARVSRRGAVKAPRAAVRSVAARAGGVGTPFTTWILQQEMEENIDGELAVVLSSIRLARILIASCCAYPMCIVRSHWIFQRFCCE